MSIADACLAAKNGKVYYQTTTMCPECETLIPGEVRGFRDGVFITRICPEHGFFKGLVCSDLDWYERLDLFDVKPVKPAYQLKPRIHGCPRDCGLCPSHRQKAGTAAVEISNKCNLTCPVCLADNKGTFELSVEELTETVGGLLKAQGHIDVLTLSGGEPTIHPKLIEMLEALGHMDIGRIVVNSNGMRIAEDDAFLNRLAGRSNVYVCLHFDGTGAKEIRGVDSRMQERAMERLSRWNINCIPLVLAVQGINDRDLGIIAADLLTRSGSIRTVMLSLMAYTGRGGTKFHGEPLRRLTIPEALERLEDGSSGRMRKKDFMPLPMPNPLCAAIGYFLVEEDRLIPLIPVAGTERVVEFLANAHFGEPDSAFENFFRETIDEIYANPERFGDAEALLSSLRALLERLFPSSGPGLSDEERRAIAEERIKSVYLMQFMDSWTFDSVRMSKCSCQHLLPDGLVVPSCGYYCFHRRFDPRFAA